MAEMCGSSSPEEHTRSAQELHSSIAYVQDALYVGPMNKETEENPVSNRRLQRIWYLKISQKRSGNLLWEEDSLGANGTQR